MASTEWTFQTLPTKVQTSKVIMKEICKCTENTTYRLYVLL